MYTLFVILIVVAAILMIGIVLIQESKGGGLSSSFAGYNQVAGVRKTTDFIEKATWALAAAMVAISIICAWVAPTASTDASVMENIENPRTLLLPLLRHPLQRLLPLRLPQHLLSLQTKDF